MLDTSLTKASSRSVAAMLMPIITTAFAAPAQAQEITLSVSGIVSDVNGNETFHLTFADAPGSVVHVARSLPMFPRVPQKENK